jgi:hypothetical protein
MVIMRSRKYVMGTVVMKSGAGSCPVVGSVIGVFEHVVWLRREFVNCHD